MTPTNETPLIGLGTMEPSKGQGGQRNRAEWLCRCAEEFS